MKKADNSAGGSGTLLHDNPKEYARWSDILWETLPFRAVVEGLMFSKMALKH